MSNDSQEVVQRIPMAWATALTVAVSLPFGFFLGSWNFTLWAAFIVWAEYFALGAIPSTWKLIIPSIPYGAAIGAAWCMATVYVAGFIGGANSVFWGMFITNFIFLPLLIYLMGKVSCWTEGSLATFNGFSLFLAIYFTASMPKVGPLDNPYWVIIMSLIWTVLMCYFGWILGWLNVTLLFTKKKDM